MRRVTALLLAGALAAASPASPASASPAAPGTASNAPAAAPDTLHLPAPTGPHPVGTTSLHLKDTSRADPWVPSVKARELMVSLWYPARSPGRQRAPYMTPKESELFLKDAKLTDLPPALLSTTRTNAFTGAKPAGRAHGLPLVVLSPGSGKPRSTLTGLAEDLASRGYVVAAIDHTYETVATTFPDGRVTTCVPCEGDHDPSMSTKQVKVRAADVSFVLDRLTGPRPAWKGGRLIDRSRMGMAGHSIGGASTVTALSLDSRLRAGIDIDGTTPPDALTHELKRPFMFLGKPATYTPGMEPAATWERDWKLMTGWKRWLLVTGAEHASFNDVGVLAAEVGIDTGADLPAERGLAITRTYVAAFFDRHLLNTAQPLLDAPSASYPEVKHCVPEKKICA
ncbi:alpha/beta hydrolase family protein [Nonomuraea roseoviolacea]|uniref:Dienelactone hydrolase n=1 Tax=Nonomuraea roseoviolacea subsp. carminata TaxID=160689 RepID=A0ABT1KBD6_9ACTN|nr:alpha/beta hydrolase [Nonomuraea roseoviolacea]MCP2351331.1 dienelactone hydrolase [Nonomuraea roseoviolacea subsp. carminata]